MVSGTTVWARLAMAKALRALGAEPARSRRLVATARKLLARIAAAGTTK